MWVEDYNNKNRVISSAVRASALQAECHWFDSSIAHFINKKVLNFEKILSGRVTTLSGRVKHLSGRVTNLSGRVKYLSGSRENQSGWPPLLSGRLKTLSVLKKTSIRPGHHPIWLTGNPIRLAKNTYPTGSPGYPGGGKGYREGWQGYPGVQSNLVTMRYELKEEKIKKLLATPIIALMK